MDHGTLSARILPMLWGSMLGRRRLVFPDGLWTHFHSIQKDAVLAHELAHVMRRDHWVRRLETIVMGLYWWFPVASWSRRQLVRAEEECCDALVLGAQPASAAVYADGLVATAAFISGLRLPLPLGVTGAGRVRPIKRRLNMLFEESKRDIRAGATRRGLIVMGVLALPLLPALTLGKPESVASQVARKSADHHERLQKESSGVTELEVDQVMSRLITARQDLFRANISYRTKVDELRMELGLPPEAPIALSQHSRLQDKNANPAMQRPRAAEGKTALDAPKKLSRDSEKKPLKVRICQAIEREVRDYEDLFARIEPVHAVQIRARVSGYLVSISSRPGQVVQKGDNLFQIDPRSYRLELDKAEAEVRRSQSRLKPLSARLDRVTGRSQQERAILAAELEEAEAALQAAKAVRDLA